MSYDVHLSVNCSCGGRTNPEERDVFSSNYTSNCSRMWDAAGCSLRDWAYDKAAGRRASTLIEPLRTAIRTMEEDPQRFREMEPDNRWGSYDGALKWLRSILSACEEYPEASVYVSN